MLVDREASSAMLDCEDGAKQADCKHCQGGGESSDSQQPQRYWDIPLDADLLETIVKIYPDWFKDSVEHKNKESLKVKLMLRRPNKRADQGILPPLKSPPAFHEQIQKLERSNMGDILKHKFQKKPDRQDLIASHHVLDESVEKLAKKARLSDDHLPKGVDEELLTRDHQVACPSPRLRTTFEEDSGSDGAFSPSYDFSEHSQSSVPSLEALSPASSVSSSPSCLPLDHVTATGEFLVLHHPTAKNHRKKPKPKPPQPKQMKFHEYKGPPSAQKPAQSSSSEQQYSEPLNAQQHQLLIQLQMECEQQQHGAARQQQQQPRPPPSADQSVLPKPAVQPPVVSPPASPQKLLLSNFEDLKVSDLKAELKKKGLPVSGSKPQLIQRLRSHSQEEEQLVGEEVASDHIVQLQQIWIETLTREVERSREQLRECQIPPPELPSADHPPPKGESKKQIIQQLLQQKIQQQELQKRQQLSAPSTLTALLESAPLLPQDEGAEFGGEELLPVYVCEANRSLPSNFIQPSVSSERPRPPDYSEATRHLKQHLLSEDGGCNPRKKHKAVKSQAVDDVLDILISSGELSPSAAQEPFFPSAPKEVPPSLQSMLDLTPPPSTGFSSSAAVDFDFPLDLDGLEPEEQRNGGVDDSGLIEWLEESSAFHDSLLGGQLDFFSADLDFSKPSSNSDFLPSWTEHAT